MSPKVVANFFPKIGAFFQMHFIELNRHLLKRVIQLALPFLFQFLENQESHILEAFSSMFKQLLPMIWPYHLCSPNPFVSLSLAWQLVHPSYLPSLCAQQSL